MARKKKTENETQAESAVSTQPAADAQAASPADTETDGVMAETDPAFADQPPDSPIPAEAPATDAPAAVRPWVRIAALTVGMPRHSDSPWCSARWRIASTQLS